MKGFTLIDNVWVENRIFSTYFSCDYDKCKGACCWAGDAKDYDGGTLLAEEAQEILHRKTALSPFTSEDLRSIAENSPVYTRNGGIYTKLHSDGRCVYMNGKGCALKDACAAGKLSFDIPVYCQLYPLWVSEHSDGNMKLFLADSFEEFCRPAFEKGLRDKTTLLQFCRIPLIRFFGGPFYQTLFNMVTQE